MSGDGELMLSILASFAQEESRSISENSKWGMGTKEFDEDAFTQQVKEIRVLGGGRLEYHFTDGRIVSWEKM